MHFVCSYPYTPVEKHKEDTTAEKFVELDGHGAATASYTPPVDCEYLRIEVQIAD